MAFFIVKVAILILAIYALLILVELFTKRSIKIFFVELFIFLILSGILRVMSDSQELRRIAFGGISPITAIIIMFGSIILGIIANHRYVSRKISWHSLSRPIVISPMILLPLIGTLPSSTDLESLQLICLSIIAFQNGFFWKTIFERIGQYMGSAPLDQLHKATGEDHD